MTKGGIASLWSFILIKMVKYLPSTFGICQKKYILPCLRAVTHRQVQKAQNLQLRKMPKEYNQSKL
jgi:hypothetical protein